MNEIRIATANEIFQELESVIDRVKDDWWKYEYICGLKEAQNVIQKVLHKYS